MYIKHSKQIRIAHDPQIEMDIFWLGVILKTLV